MPLIGAIASFSPIESNWKIDLAQTLGWRDGFLHDNTCIAMQEPHEHRHINQVQKKPQKPSAAFSHRKAYRAAFVAFGFLNIFWPEKLVLMATMIDDHTWSQCLLCLYHWHYP
jgi:hypothetical protein